MKKLIALLSFAVSAFAADIKIRDLSTTLVLPASNTFFIADGATQNTGKVAVANFPQITSTRTTLAGLSVTNVSTGVTVQTLGGSSVGDGAATLYYYNSASAATPNGTTIIQPSVGSGRWLALSSNLLPNPSTTTLGGVFSIAPVANQYLTSIGTNGQPTLAAITASNVSGLGTMATQNSTAIAVTGGTINGATIGATTPATGAFTTLSSRGFSASTVGLATSMDLSLAADTSQFKQTLLKTGSAVRWSYGSNSTAESGSNAGSDFTLARWSDAGSYIQDVFGITRSTGNVTWYEHSNNFRYNSIGTTSTPSLDIQNESSATSGTPQWSPALHFKGDTWRTGSGNRAGAHWKVEVQTPTAATGTNNLVFSSDISDSPTYAARVTMADTGLTVAGGTISNLYTRTGTSTTPSVWGVNSDATTYNMLTLNNVASRAGMMGMSGGGGVDASLYVRAPSGGTVIQAINNSTVVTTAATGLTVVGGIQQTNVFNVRNYGALGNGSANDTSFIASAIAAAKAAHGIVYFPAGTYMTDLMTVTSATGLTICGDGMGVTIIKARSPSQVLNLSSSSKITVFGITFDGSCTTRTAGQQAVVFDTCVGLDFHHNEIINSGEFALFIGYTSSSNVRVTNNFIGLNYADGINIGHVTNYIVADNEVNGADDDLIACNGQYGIIIGNTLKSRNDLGTGWGRGIWCGDGLDLIIANNTVYGSKQTGIFLNQEGASKVARVKVIGNTVVGTPIISGQPIAAVGVQDCTIENNTVYGPAISVSGLIEIANWDSLKVSGNKLYQRTNSIFARGVHVTESTGYADTTWSDLTVKDNEIYFTGDSTSTGIYLQPNSANTMDVVIVDNNIVKQPSGAGNYIQVSGLTTTMGKIVNNTTMTAGSTISPSAGGVFTVTNNN